MLKANLSTEHILPSSLFTLQENKSSTPNAYACYFLHMFFWPTQANKFQAPFMGRIKHSGSWWLTLAWEQVMWAQHSPTNWGLIPHLVLLSHSPQHKDAVLFPSAVVPLSRNLLFSARLSSFSLLGGWFWVRLQILVFILGTTSLSLLKGSFIFQVLFPSWNRKECVIFFSF